MTQSDSIAPSAPKPRSHHGTKLTQAAGSLSALALLPAGAQAGIIFVNTDPVSMTLNSSSMGSAAPWDVDQDTLADFQLVHSSFGFGSETLGISPGKSYFVNTGGPNFALDAMPAGSIIGATLAGACQWNSGSTHPRIILFSTSFEGVFGGLHAGDNYIGFRFLSGGSTTYGWANINLDPTGPKTAIITEWAYNDTPGGAICVGETSGPGGSCAAAVPEPGTASLALLGLGLGGLRAFRARKRQAASNA